MSESFADAPISIGEIRSERSENGADWSPRDVLISILRQIDKDEIEPNALVVAWGEINATGGGRIDYVVSAPNMVVTLGLLTRALHRINENCDPE